METTKFNFIKLDDAMKSKINDNRTQKEIDEKEKLWLNEERF